MKELPSLCQFSYHSNSPSPSEPHASALVEALFISLSLGGSGVVSWFLKSLPLVPSYAAVQKITAKVLPPAGKALQHPLPCFISWWPSHAYAPSRTWKCLIRTFHKLNTRAGTLPPNNHTLKCGSRVSCSIRPFLNQHHRDKTIPFLIRLSVYLVLPLLKIPVTLQCTYTLNIHLHLRWQDFPRQCIILSLYPQCLEPSKDFTSKSAPAG